MWTEVSILKCEIYQKLVLEEPFLTYAPAECKNFYIFEKLFDYWLGKANLDCLRTIINLPHNVQRLQITIFMAWFDLRIFEMDE